MTVTMIYLSKLQLLGYLLVLERESSYSIKMTRITYDLLRTIQNKVFEEYLRNQSLFLNQLFGNRNLLEANEKSSMKIYYQKIWCQLNIT